MRIGIVGIGNMGDAIARRLLGQGHEVAVYNRTRSRAEALRGMGARVADRVEDVCRQEVVVSMLADDRAVEDLFLRAPLPFAEGTVHVSASTISVSLAKRLTEMHTSRGESHVGAPVLGRPERAESGQLVILAGGLASALARCRSLFEVTGSRTYVAGDEPWQGHLVKLAANFLLASTIEGLSEVAAFVRKSGVEVRPFLEMLTETMFSSPVYKTYAALIASARYQPAAFRMPLGLKDVELVLAAARGYGVPLPLAELVRDGFQKGLAEGYADLDWSALALVRAKEAGLDR